MNRIAIILCGGLGTRFRPISSSPKILARFQNTTYIDWLYGYLVEHNFNRVILCLGYKSAEIIDYIEENKLPIETEYIIEDTKLGTGGATLNAMKHYGIKDAFIFNGDTYWGSKIPQEMFASTNLDGYMCVSKMGFNKRFGRVIQNLDHTVTITRNKKEVSTNDCFVYAGIFRLLLPAEMSSIRLPYSLEEFIVENKLQVIISELTTNFIDYGTLDGFKQIQDLDES